MSYIPIWLKGSNEFMLTVIDKDLSDDEKLIKLSTLIKETKIDERNESKRTALMLGIMCYKYKHRGDYNCSLKIINYLLENRADPNLETDQFNCLTIATAYSNDLDLIKLLIKYDSKVQPQLSQTIESYDIIKIFEIKLNHELEKQRIALLKQTEELLKEQKLKIYEEIYAPGGVGYDVARERFNSIK